MNKAILFAAILMLPSLAASAGPRRSLAVYADGQNVPTQRMVRALQAALVRSSVFAPARFKVREDYQIVFTNIPRMVAPGRMNYTFDVMANEKGVPRTLGSVAITCRDAVLQTCAATILARTRATIGG